MADDEETMTEEDWSRPVDCGISNSDTDMTLTDHCAGSSAERVHPRTIVHIDLDCFYAQVEMVRNPTLRNKPLGIQQKYLLVTCNYVARSRGVTKLMRVAEALQRCPDLVIVSGEDLTHYREMSYRITELLHQFTPLVERLGFDENFIDVSNLVEKRLLERTSEISGHVYGEESTDTVPQPVCPCGCHSRLLIGSHIANEMRETLRTHLRLTSCAGTAHNKLLAKLVGSVHKPNDQTTLFPHMASSLMASLHKVTQVPGIGHSTGKKLSALGITTLSDLLEAPFTMLKNEFGYQTATTMQKLCQGYDELPVVQSGPPQSISDEDSFRKCSSLQEAKLKTEALLTSLLQRLKKDGRQPQTLRLSVRKYSETHKWSRESRQCAMPDGILRSLRMDEAAATNRLLDLCVSLFHKMVDTSKPFHLTLINVCFAKFHSASTATSDISKFFSPKSARKEIEGGVLKISKLAGTRTSGRECINGLQAMSNRDLDTKAETPVASSTSLSVAGSRGTNAKLQQDEFPEDISQNSSHKVNVEVNACAHRCDDSVPLQLSKDSQGSCNMHTDCTDTGGNSSSSKTDKSGIVVRQQSQSFDLARQLQNEAGLRNCDVSPGKRHSFFATKSNTRSLSCTGDKNLTLTTPVCFEASNEANSSKNFVREKPKSDDYTSVIPVYDSVCSEREGPQRPNVNTDQFPPNVDPSVFAELPKDMQQELQKEWRNAAFNMPTPQTVGKPSERRMDSETVSCKTQLSGFQDIDRSVLEELPPDIQKEILEQENNRKRPLASLSPETKKTSPVKRSKPSHTKRDRTACRSKNIASFFVPK